jgi:hypothetical protein
MEEQLAELEQRVSHLERELETSYDEVSFKRAVQSIFSDEQEIEFRNGHYGYFAQVTNLDGDDVQVALDRLDNYDFGSAVTETGSGLGMEIWSEPEV